MNELPELPTGLNTLYLVNIPTLHCLPPLPEGFTDLYLDLEGAYNPTGVTCLPNVPSTMFFMQRGSNEIPISNDLLCTVLNSTCDFVNPVATGTVYHDQNANGTRDGGESGYPLATIAAQPGNITYGVPANGEYELPLPLDQYTLTASSSNPYVLSIAPASHDAPFSAPTDVDSGNDFGVVLQSNVQDIRIDLSGPWGRPGFETSGHITYDNIGTIVVSGTITLELDADQTWVSSTPAPTDVSGNTITWSFADLQIGESRGIGLTVYTNLSVSLGTELIHVATAGPVAGDVSPADNTDVYTDVVVGSFDPNDKLVEPTTLLPEQIAAGEEIEYTIRFQNTGTYPADRVLILDTLSDDLQWSTMRFVTSSHPCTWLLTGNGVLRFTFEPILLPDSISDEPNSHGFVKFAMKPSTSLMPGESVSNTANIYFDFNEPVITAPAIFTVDVANGVGQAAEGAWSMWPNPAEDILFISGQPPGAIEVIDVDGAVVRSRSNVFGNARIDLHGLASGAYALRITSNGTVTTRTFIKH